MKKIILIIVLIITILMLVDKYIHESAIPNSKKMDTQIVTFIKSLDLKPDYNCYDDLVTKLTSKFPTLKIGFESRGAFCDSVYFSEELFITNIFHEYQLDVTRDGTDIEILSWY